LFIKLLSPVLLGPEIISVRCSVSIQTYFVYLCFVYVVVLRVYLCIAAYFLIRSALLSLHVNKLYYYYYYFILHICVQFSTFNSNSRFIKPYVVLL
jgi:hypothetical protein